MKWTQRRGYWIEVRRGRRRPCRQLVRFFPFYRSFLTYEISGRGSLQIAFPIISLTASHLFSLLEESLSITIMRNHSCVIIWPFYYGKKKTRKTDERTFRRINQTQSHTRNANCSRILL